MTQTERPLRADAARNRARVLEVAYDTFASEGLSVPIDEIARRAGVGAGTVYRHFPTKEDLYRAVVADRIQRIVNDGRALLADEDPAGGAVRVPAIDGAHLGRHRPRPERGARWDGYRRATVIPDVEEEFLGMLGDLLRMAQNAGTARADLEVADVKAMLVGLQAMQSYNGAAARAGRTPC